MYILKHLLIKPKKIFECLSCFWKVFWFENVHKNPKICNSASSRLTHESIQSRASSRKLTQNGSRLPSRLTLGWTSSREKHLDKFFKICHTGFWQLDLVTCLRLIPVTKNVCFALWGLFSGQFSKKNFIFPSLIVTVHCLVRSFPFQTHRVLSKNPSFSSQSLHKSSREGMGFLIFSKYSMFLALDFLDFVFLFEIWKYDVEYGLWMKVQIVCKTPMNV